MGKRDVVKQNRSKQKRQDLVVILIIAVFAVVIVGLIVLSKLPKVVTADTREHPNASELNMGDPNAPVKVVEFADFQCPYCQMYWEQVEPGIVKDYVATGKVYYTYAPMAFLGQESIDSAEAAYCANDQGKFWDYRDMLFANHTGENVGDFTTAKLQAFASKLGMDTATFNQCLSSGKYKTAVDDANTFASSQGVNSTPTIMVNGKIYSAGEAVSAIEAALAGK
jgi:protein-disulfide isomerase